MELKNFFWGEDLNKFNESISFPSLPTYLIKSEKKYKKIKIKFNRSNDNFKEELGKKSCYTINNILDNQNRSIDKELGHDFEEINKIMQLDKMKIKDISLPINDQKDESSKGKKEKHFGRKRKNSSEIGKHDKYSGDNLIRKCKGVILNSLYDLINNLINEQYKFKSEEDKRKKQLLKINQFQIINSDVDFNKKFINKKLKDIFSDNITMKYKKFNVEHNKILIESLLNEKDKEKKKFFTKLFNLTFLDCLNHFRGTKTIKELNDLEKYENICKKFEEDEDYLYSFKFFIENYEQIIGNKKARMKKNGKKEKINK